MDRSYEYAKAALSVADALAKIAIEAKRYNDIKEKQLREATAAKRLSNQGFG